LDKISIINKSKDLSLMLKKTESFWEKTFKNISKSFCCDQQTIIKEKKNKVNKIYFKNNKNSISFINKIIGIKINYFVKIIK